MVKRLWHWLGAESAWMLTILLVGMVIGVVGVQVSVEDADSRLSLQLAMVWAFVAVLGLMLSARMTGQARRRLWIALGPGLVLLGLGVLLPPLALFFGGGGLGWMIAGQIVLRGNVRMEYQSAVKHMRKGEYDQALAVMDQLVRAEPNAAEHYRFRAELFRLAGKPQKALSDYRRVVELTPDAIAGYAGLAETTVLQGNFDEARKYAKQALKHDRGGWMAAYNLGMIEDRRMAAKDSVRYLEQAVEAQIPHVRYRLMARLWLARNYARLGRNEDAKRAAEQMRKESKGLREWEVIMQSDEAVSLRDLLADDVALARRMIESSSPVDELSAD